GEGRDPPFRKRRIVGSCGTMDPGLGRDDGNQDWRTSREGRSSSHPIRSGYLVGPLPLAVTRPARRMPDNTTPAKSATTPRNRDDSN
ncbi:hypothetical protein, partial [Sphingomonas endophytica]|uniref:hypothetical protein n=1 Tax=Sphingomonas endophytica TaxID=869719 RepID=UPI0019D39D01